MNPGRVPLRAAAKSAHCATAPPPPPPPTPPPVTPVPPRPVYLSLLVLEDAQTADLVRHPLRIFLGVVDPDPEQDTKPAPHGSGDSSLDSHGRLGDPLHHRTHAAPHTKPWRAWRAWRLI